MVSTKRNLDHLEYDENLYDFMRFLIPFQICPQNKSLNKYVFQEYGLEKHSFLNVFFNDTVGKNELVLDLLLQTVMPKEWSLGDDNSADDEVIQIPEAQELLAVLIDVQGSFQARLFNEKVKQAYNRHELWKCLGPHATDK